jgi:uncharacterized protein (DUF1800 family)
MAPAVGALQGAIAAIRFGLGARPGEIEAACPRATVSRGF